MSAGAALSVVVCCYDRADGTERLAPTLEALNRQTIRDRLEVLVVDDGSTPPIEERSVTKYGAKLFRHPANRGLATARNTGIAASLAPVVAFTDDDCRPGPGWAASLLSPYDDPDVAAVGGPVVASHRGRFLERYYRESQPVRPLEAALGRSSALPYRFWLYCRENVAPRTHEGERDVYSLVGANFSFRRSVLYELGGFDANIRFGGEDEDICHRLRQEFPDRALRVAPAAVVEHDYDADLRDALRRARAYGIGNAGNYYKHDGWSPTIYPGPLFWAIALVLSAAARRGRVAATILPLLFAPRWAIAAARARSAEPLAYGYVQVLQEAAADVGFATGWWRHRHRLAPEGAPT